MLWAWLGGLPVFLESITMNSSAREYQGKSTGGGGGGSGSWASAFCLILLLTLDPIQTFALFSHHIRLRCKVHLPFGLGE